MLFPGLPVTPLALPIVHADEVFVHPVGKVVVLNPSVHVTGVIDCVVKVAEADQLAHAPPTPLTWSHMVCRYLMKPNLWKFQ